MRRCCTGKVRTVMPVEKSIRVLRVVTSTECVEWHIGKTLTYLSRDFEVMVAGDRVSVNQAAFPDVAWADIAIARKINLWADLKALVLLFVLCRRYKPDVVHSIMPKAGLLTAIAAWLAGVPVRMHTFTGQVWDTKRGLPRAFLKALDRLVVLLNTRCLTDSPSQSAHLLKHGVSDHGKALGSLGQGSLNGVDLGRFDKARISASSKVSRTSVGLGETDFVITYAARKSIDKGALDMLRAFAMARKRIQHMRLLFVGPDESNGAIEALRAATPEAFEGVVEFGLVRNLEDYLALSDVLCLPSYREGFGSVVIDAAALEVPCVGSRIPGLVNAIVDGETGVLFPVGDVDQLSDILVALESDRDRLKQLGKAASERVRKVFSSEVLYSHLANLYKEQLVLAGSKFKKNN